MIVLRTRIESEEHKVVKLLPYFNPEYKSLACLVSFRVPSSRCAKEREWRFPNAWFENRYPSV